MKICAISDIHGNLIDIPKCDVLCIAGDMVDLATQRNIELSKKWLKDKFVPWINGLDCGKVIATAGNHDFVFEDDTTFKDELATLTNDKFKLLIDEEYTYDGVTFYGTPWIEPIRFQKWAFEDYGIVDNPFEKIPKCDILITHENPNYNERLEYNCFGKYKHHFFGHWHDGISYGHLNQYNCSILTDNYMPRERLKIVTITVLSDYHKL